jgi:hypothetical protein
MNDMSHRTEQFLGTVDVRQLQEYRWPIVRVFSSGFVDRLELRRHKQRLLETGQWDAIRSVPHRVDARRAASGVFDIYGVPTVGTDAATHRDGAASLPRA